MQTADLLKSEGYKDIGYTYVILGDCWMSKLRDKDGNIQADKERFPSGMKSLADYVSLHILLQSQLTLPCMYFRFIVGD